MHRSSVLWCNLRKSDSQRRLRVALIAGTLRQGGAEKQLVYLARALRDSGVDVRVYCLTRGEYYESVLRTLDVPVTWVGYFGHPVVRVAKLARAISTFKPHVIQSTHSYVNLYVALVGRACNTMSLGAIRSSVSYERAVNGFWTDWLISTPTALVANSNQAINGLQRYKPNQSQRHFLLSNAIDLADYHAVPSRSSKADHQTIQACFIGQLIKVKRVDRFIRALARARALEPTIQGLVVGDGPEREPAENLADELGLLPDHLTFIGHSAEVPRLLSRADMLVLSSDEEGSPNVILEAMAAGLPVVATPAGDAKTLVQDGITGFLVGFEDVGGTAQRMVQLARSAALRRRLGLGGRSRAERDHSLESLAQRALSIYREISARRRDHRVLSILT